MSIKCENHRLILREIQSADQDDLFEMDGDARVHEFLGNKPIQDPSQLNSVIENIQNQYKNYGVGRWAVVDRETNECVGWCGLKYFDVPVNGNSNFYELGYRFKYKHWGKGLATASSRLVLDYAFQQIALSEVFAMTDPGHLKSKHVLSKLGFVFIGQIDWDGEKVDWFKLTVANWSQVDHLEK